MPNPTPPTIGLSLYHAICAGQNGDKVVWRANGRIYRVVRKEIRAQKPRFRLRVPKEPSGGFWVRASSCAGATEHHRRLSNVPEQHEFPFRQSDLVGIPKEAVAAREELRRTSKKDMGAFNGKS